MTTKSQAYAAVRTRLEANQPSGLSLRWSNEESNEPLPDEPVPFAFVELVTERARLVGFGGGRGNNLYRNPAEIQAHVLVPVGQGSAVADDFAEAVCAVFRSHRDSTISCFAASVVSDNEKSEDGQYYMAHAVIDCHFDLTG